MNVKVGDRVRVHSVTDSYARYNGSIVTITNTESDDGIVASFGDRSALWFRVGEYSPESVPDPKNTLNSIADVFRSAVVSEADIADIKKLLEEAGYEF